jgi:DNA-binding NtrC family response regulator
VPRLRVTSPQPPSVRQRIAAAQERDECLSGLLRNNVAALDRPVLLRRFDRAKRGLEVEDHSFVNKEPWLMASWMNSGETAADNAVASVAIEDVDLASQSSARVLISARTPQAVESLARRIHGAGPRARLPFGHIDGAAFPVQRDVLKEYCANVLAAATGGSVFVSAVEGLPLVVQDALIELLDELEWARGPAAGVRLISGTTVSLFDRVAAGAFSDRLFYRLNIIHVSNS